MSSTRRVLHSDTRRTLRIITLYDVITGMFPYVCAAMIPVFCDPTTTSKALRTAVETGRRSDARGEPKSEPAAVDAGESSEPPLKTTNVTTPTRAKRNAIAACLCAYALLQLFLPFSHFITQVPAERLTDAK